LRIGGYDVLQAFDGQQGLDLAKTASPDLILLDLVLPKLGGAQILEELKGSEKYKNIPIIIVSGLAMDAQNVKDYVNKADAYFMKPFDSVELMATIADFLKKSS
jgi:DNA-binding response OmpR family regulator